VYEPFLGSGTTLAAAEATDRVCCGIELDPKYVDVIVGRWEKLSGQHRRLYSTATGDRLWKSRPGALFLEKRSRPCSG
jgi:hypothetical protein